jgi:hypothetical protein
MIGKIKMMPGRPLYSPSDDDYTPVPEDPTRCIIEVWTGKIFKQCGHKRGFGAQGLLCKQHAHGMQQSNPLTIGKTP